MVRVLEAKTFKPRGNSVGNPDPHVFGPPKSGSISQRYGSWSGSFPFLIKVLSGLKQCLQNKILTQIFAKIKFFRLKIICLQVIRKYMKIFYFFAFLKSLKKGVGSGLRSGFRARFGSGSISQRYGSADPEPDPDPLVRGTDPRIQSRIRIH
jgi:hypothetical protein